MKQVISFDKLKLTNHQLDDNGHVSCRAVVVVAVVVVSLIVVLCFACVSSAYPELK